MKKIAMIAFVLASLTGSQAYAAAEACDHNSCQACTTPSGKAGVGVCVGGYAGCSATTTMCPGFNPLPIEAGAATSKGTVGTTGNTAAPRPASVAPASTTAAPGQTVRPN